MLHLKLVLDLEPADIEAKLASDYDSAPVDWLQRNAFVRSYNLQHNSLVPVLRQRSHTDPSCVLHTMQWGLTPSEGRPEVSIPIAKSAAVANDSSPLWAALRGSKRCAVVCQGFFVWRKKGKNPVPFYFKHADPCLVLLAGLYKVVQLQGQPFYSFSILVSHQDKSNKCLAPVVLRTPAALATWLDVSTGQWDAALSELVAPDANLNTFLKSYQVPPGIEDERANSPSLILPATERPDGIKAALARQPATPSRAQATPPPGASDTPDVPVTPMRRMLLKPGTPMQTPDSRNDTGMPGTSKRRRSRSSSAEEIDARASPSASAVARKRQKLTRPVKGASRRSPS